MRALTDISGLAGCTMSRTTIDAAALTVELNDDMNAANSAAIKHPRKPAGIICTITTGRIFSGSALPTKPEAARNTKPEIMAHRGMLKNPHAHPAFAASALDRVARNRCSP